VGDEGNGRGAVKDCQHWGMIPLSCKDKLHPTAEVAALLHLDGMGVKGLMQTETKAKTPKFTLQELIHYIALQKVILSPVSHT